MYTNTTNGKQTTQCIDSSDTKQLIMIGTAKCNNKKTYCGKCRELSSYIIVNASLSYLKISHCYIRDYERMTIDYNKHILTAPDYYYHCINLYLIGYLFLFFSPNANLQYRLISNETLHLHSTEMSLISPCTRDASSPVGRFGERCRIILKVTLNYVV